jgi:hypothetical protein
MGMDKWTPLPQDGKRFLNKWSTSIRQSWDGTPESRCDADDTVTTWIKSKSSKSAEDTKLPKLGMDQFIRCVC